MKGRHLLWQSLTVVLILVASGSGNAGEVPSAAYHHYERYKKQPHYRAFAITKGVGKQDSGWGWTWSHSTVEAAIEAALTNCEEGRAAYFAPYECNLHSIGNIIVFRMDEKGVQKAIKLYKTNRNATNNDLAGFVPGKSSLESAPTLAVEDHDDAKLCKIALTGSKTYWETRPVFLPYVEEAKRRGISIKGCRSKLGLEPLTPAATSGEERDEFDGEWTGVMRCASCANCIGPLEKPVSITVQDSKFEIVPDASYTGVGFIDGTGNMTIGWNSDSTDWAAPSRRNFQFSGKYNDGTFVLRGKRGPRSCDIVISRTSSP